MVPLLAIATPVALAGGPYEHVEEAILSARPTVAVLRPSAPPPPVRSLTRAPVKVEAPMQVTVVGAGQSLWAVGSAPIGCRQALQVVAEADVAVSEGTVGVVSAALSVGWRLAWGRAR